MDDAGRDDPGAVRLAYALRWLELGDGDAGADLADDRGCREPA